MKVYKTEESMKPVTWALATAAAGTAFLWAGLVTGWTTEHELSTTILFSASIPCLIASAIYLAIAVVGLRKRPEGMHRKD